MSFVVIYPIDLTTGPQTYELGMDTPHFSGGIATWTEKTRPRRRNMLEFDSEGLGKLTFDIMLDQFPHGNVEDQIRNVFALGAKLHLDQPSRLRLAGPLPYTDLTYVMTACDDSGMTDRNRFGQRCRQQLRLELTEYLAGDLVVEKGTPAAAAQERAGVSPGPERKTYVVSQGDTLQIIAAHFLGSAAKWHRIAALNGIRDPIRLTPGQVLRLP